jgi:small conductance mechanosensitive channel
MFLQSSNTSTILENVSEVNSVTRRSIENLLDSIFERLPYIVAGIIVLLIFLLLSRIFKSIFWAGSKRAKLDYRLRILFSRVIGISIIILGIFTAMTIIIPTLRFGDLITGLGFTSFVIGFATKDILNNLLSGVLILLHQPFRIGDYVFIGNNQGKVEFIGVRATHLRKDDGELVLIPNGDLYSNALTIRGAGTERRMRLNISIGHDSNIAGSKEIIERVLSEEKGIVSEPKPSVVVTDLTSDGVNVSIYFWIDTDKFRPQQVFDNIATEVNQRLSENGIELFPPSSIILQKSEPINDVENVNAEEPNGKRKKDDVF